MFKKNKIDDPPPYVKFTKYGFPYVDVDNYLKSEEGKKLIEQMKQIRNPSANTSESNDQEIGK